MSMAVARFHPCLESLSDRRETGSVRDRDPEPMVEAFHEDVSSVISVDVDNVRTHRIERTAVLQHECGC